MADTKKKITIRDLQTFIEAVEFASDKDDWVPSERQWRRIRQMIDDLEEAPAAAHQPQQRQQQPMSFAPATYAGPPIAGSAIPPAQPVGPSSLSPVFGSGPQPAKAPDIDTSNGTYKSTFM